jgi:hypothetical protein
MLPVFVAIGAFIPLLFCLCKLWLQLILMMHSETESCGKKSKSRDVYKRPNCYINTM